jgi:two-component system sensor kinase FixL
MQESSATAVLSLKNDDEIVGVSRGVEDLLGWTADDLLGANVGKVLAAEAPGVALALPETPSSAAVTGLRSDGERLLLRAELRRWEAGNDRFATVYLEPTPVADAEQGRSSVLRTAQQIERRFDALLDASPDAIVITDECGRIDTFNMSAERLFGYREKDVQGVSFARLLPLAAARDEADETVEFLSSLSDEAGATREFFARRRDGAIFPVELSVGKTESGEALCYIAIMRDVSRRRQAAAALARSEANLRMAQAMVHLGSFELVFPSDEPMYWSDEVFRILGRDPAAGVPDIAVLRDQMLHPDDRERVVEAVSAACRHGGALRLDYRVLRPDDSVCHVQTAVRITPAEAKNTWRASGTILDTSERRRIERALRFERDRAELYLDLVGVIVVAVDINGNVTLINRQGLETLGISEPEVIGRNFLTLFIPEEFRNRALRQFNALITDPSDTAPRIDEGWVETHGGQRLLIQWRNKKLVDSAGRTVGVLGAGEDVTEQRCVQGRLKQAEEELRLTVQHAPIGMATLDLEGHILSVNQSLCSMLGFEESQLLGVEMKEIIHPDDRAVAAALLQRLLGGEIEYVRHEKRYQRQNGSLVFGIVRYSLIRNSRGRPLMFVAQIVDRTEQIQAELEVRQHRERLAQVSRLGTMGEMAAGVAHELNQPLTAIANYARACQRMIDADTMARAELKEILGKVSGQARRAGHVIQGLRSFVKKRAIARRPTDVARVIRDVMMLAELDGRAHGIPITSDTQEGLPLVQADPVQLQQVILNLVRNAVDSMAGGDRRDKGVTVVTRLEAPDEICVSVEDHGSGVDEEAATRLFDPFFTTKAEGMGMGLALSRSIVEAHGGRLIFTDNPAGGTIFRMSLPTLPEDL